MQTSYDFNVEANAVKLEKIVKLIRVSADALVGKHHGGILGKPKGTEEMRLYKNNLKDIIMNKINDRLTKI